MQIMVYWLKIFNLDITKENKHDIILITINPSKILIKINKSDKFLVIKYPIKYENVKYSKSNVIIYNL